MPTGPCKSELGCRLNGACTGGRCVCDSGWVGDNCEILDVEMGSVAYGLDNTRESADSSCWGGGPPVWDGKRGKYSMILTEIAGHCGMQTWGFMSQATLVQSPSLTGPYERVGVVAPTETHNVFYARAPDGTHLVYHIGQSDNPSSCNPWIQCVNGTTPPSNRSKPTCPPDMSCALHYAASLDGPWSYKRLPLADVPFLKANSDHGAGTNPSPLFFKNGTVMVATRGPNQLVINGTKQHYPNVFLFVADGWNASEYKWVPSSGDNGAVCVNSLGSPSQTEDPVLWRGRRGFHMLFHENTSHAWSEDGINWFWTPDNAVPGTVNITTQHGLVERRTDTERPRVVVSPDGDVVALFKSSRNPQEPGWTGDGSELLVWKVKGSR